MYVDNIKTAFYDLIIKKRVVVFVNYDIDAICSFKIIEHLFKYDEVLFTMIPVKGLEDLTNQYKETPNENVIVLINCGGTIDIVDVLEPEPEVVFFILDSHRPTDVCNIYSQSQVRLLGRYDNDIPDYDDIFREDEEEESDSEHSDEFEEPAERRSKNEARLLKQRERRVWEENRHKVMFDYTQYSYYSTSSASVMFDLAWKLTKDNLDLLWWAIVGLTEQQILKKIEPHQFLLDAGTLQTHMLRLSHQQEQSDLGTQVRITFETDLQLILYRHWTLEAALYNTRYTACKLRIWSLKGERLLQQLLADIGIPLFQSKQRFGAMDLELRNEFCQKMTQQAEKYELGEISAPSFMLQYGYRQRYTAADVVYSLLSLLESCESSKPAGVTFTEALDALSRSNRGLLESGIEVSKEMLRHSFDFVRNAINMRLVQSAGHFFFLTIQDGMLSYRQLVQPHCLSLLTRFVLEAYAESARSRRASSQPLIISAPYIDGFRLVLGIPPVTEGVKNFLGKAFEKAAENSQIEAHFDFFDNSYVLIKMEDQERFVDALTDLLQ